MPTLTIALDAGAQSRALSKTISTEHLTRFLDALKLRLATEENPTPTNEEVFDIWAERLVLGGARQITLQEEERAARKAADSGVTPIDLT